MVSAKVQQAISSLQSDRQTDRAAGLEAYRDLFTSERILNDLRGDDATWLTVYQALSAAVLVEKQACTRKGDPSSAPAAAVNRLAANAQTLRWLVETTVHFVERKTLKSLVSHIVQMLNHNGRLLQPVALDYLKAMRAVLAYPPHRNSLDPDQWTRVASLCFNVVLSRPLDRDLPRWKGFADLSEELQQESGRALGLEDIEEMSCLEELMSSDNAPLCGQDRVGLRCLAQYSSFLDRFPSESTAHLPALSGLTRLLRDVELSYHTVVQEFARRHWKTLVALWDSKSKPLKEYIIIALRILIPHVLADPGMNDDSTYAGEVSDLLLFSVRQLLKDSTHRVSIGALSTEHLQLQLRESEHDARPFQCSTFASGRTFESSQALSWLTLELLSDLVAKSQQLEATTAQQPLSTEKRREDDTPRSDLEEDDEVPTRYGARRHGSYRSYPTPPQNDRKRALAKTSQGASASPLKRRRMSNAPACDIVGNLLLQLNVLHGDAALKAQQNRLWHLQIVLFSISCHWVELPDDSRRAIGASVFNLLTDGDPVIRSWAFVCTASIAASSSQFDVGLDWSQTLTLAVRRINISTTSRAAALAASAIIKSGRCNKAQVLLELTSLLSDFNLSFPAFPFDSVCDFLVLAMQLHASDVSMSKTRCEDRIGSWLLSTWSPTRGIDSHFRSRNKVEEVDSAALCATLCRICKLNTTEYGKFVWEDPGSIVLPSCPSVEQATGEYETRKLRSFLLRSIVTGKQIMSSIRERRKSQPSHSASREMAGSSQASKTSSGDQRFRPLSEMEKRISVFLHTSIEVLTSAWTSSPNLSNGSDNLAFADEATADQVRRTLDVVTIALIFHAELLGNHIQSDETLAQAAHSLLTEVMQTVADPNRWSDHTRAVMLVAIAPLVGCRRVSHCHHDVEARIEILVDPGPSSGVRRSVLEKMSNHPDSDSFAASPRATEAFLQRVWSATETHTQQDFLKELQRCLRTACGMRDDKTIAGKRHDRGLDDEWGVIRLAHPSNERAGPSSGTNGKIDLSLAALASICVSGLIDIPRCLPAAGSQKRYLDEILSEEHLLAVHCASPAFFSAVAGGRIKMSQRDATSTMTMLGTRYLPDYQFRTSEYAQLVAIKYLEATMPLWQEPDRQDTDLAARSTEFCIHFARTVGKGKVPSWRVRVRIAAFFVSLLESTVRRDGWTDDGQTLCSASLLSLVSSLIEDDDARVRLAACSFTARLFDFTPSASNEQIYEDVVSRLAANLMVDHELRTTRTLLCANIIVRSSSVRSPALYHLIEPLIQDVGKGPKQQEEAHAKNLLQHASTLLGFASPCEMTRIFAAQMTFALVRSGKDPIRLPWSVLGYTSLRQGLEDNFLAIGSMMAAIALDDRSVYRQFASLSRSLAKTEAQGVAECLPVVVAIELVITVRISEKTISDPATSLGDLFARLAPRKNALTTETALQKTFTDAFDQIIFAILVQFWEKTDFLPQLRKIDAAVAQELVGLDEGVPQTHPSTHAHVPHRPIAGALDVFSSVRIAEAAATASCHKDISMDTRKAASVYHVAQRMLSLIWSEHLVNDQLRHLNALKLFLAMQHDAISRSPVVLKLLLHGSSVLMTQQDLLSPASGIFRWCLRKCFHLPRAPRQLGKILIALHERADACNRSSHRLSSVESEHAFAWSEELLPSLLASPQLRRSALDAIYAYPHELPSAVKKTLDRDLHHRITLKGLSEFVANNPKLSLNAQLLCRFHTAIAGAAGDNSALERFSSSTIWQLFSRLSRSESRDAGSVLARALADTLFAIYGKVSTPTASQYQESQQSQSLVGDQSESLLQALLDRSPDRPQGPIKAFIALQLLELMSDENLQLAQSALFCLRAILESQVNFTDVIAKWPEGIVEEMKFISVFPTAPEVSAQKADIEMGVQHTDFRDFSKWLCGISTCLCDQLSSMEPNSFFAQIRPLLARESSLASQVLPGLLHACLCSVFESAGQEGSLAREVTEPLRLHFTSALEDNDTDHRVWSSIISSLIYMRKQPMPSSVVSKHAPSSLTASDHWLTVDFLLLARRSIDCHLYTTGLLWIELEREHERDRWAQETEQEIISALLYEIYSNVEDPDSFYGVKNRDVRGALLQRLHHEGEWQRAFELHAADFESQATDRNSLTDDNLEAETSVALHEMGYNRLAASLSSASAAPASRRRTADYEVAWRTEQWDLPSAAIGAADNGLNVFAALRALHCEREPAAIDAAIAQAMAAEADHLAAIGVEAITQVRQYCRDLLCLREAQEWRSQHRHAQGDLSHLLTQCAQWALLSEEFAFDDFEKLLMVRQSLLRAERVRAQGDQIGDLFDSSTQDAIATEGDLLLRVCHGARTQERQQSAMNAITRAQRLYKQLPTAVWPVSLSAEFASVLWAQGEHAIAMEALDETVTADYTGANQRDRAEKALWMAQLGQWRVTARSQQPHIIDQTYFRPAYALVKDQKGSCGPVCYRYAVFADQQYRHLRDSEEARKLQQFVDDRREEIRQNATEMGRVNKKSDAYRQLSHHRSQAERILRQDVALLDQISSSRTAFLEQALKMYAGALASSSDYDDCVVRLTSLWYENAEDNQFNDAIRQAIESVPSHKFLRLTHQLSSRLSTSYGSSAAQNSRPQGFSFQQAITRLMTRMCYAHPFHSLYAIFALRKAGRDEESLGAASTTPTSAGTRMSSKKKPTESSAGLRASSTAFNSPSPSSLRAAAATELWQNAKTGSHLKARVEHLEKVCEAYVEWAELNLRKSMPSIFSSGSIKKGPYRFPTDIDLAIKRLKSVPVPPATMDVPIDPTGQYRNTVGIERYSDVFNQAGGLHLPKIIECIGTDGKRYKQLFKSEDDLRQDAVMQQVFRMLNELLARDRRAKERHLKVRTYVVLPLGPQCGLLEFVGNTQTIGEALVRTHEQHRVGDELTPADARGELAAVMGKSPQEKLNVYRSVCERMPPAFHYHFLERFKAPPLWFAVRLNYTRSVATSSIIGHVLGLGDRHVSNILLDDITGEVIHIDFGVAFEQGKLLPIPELVPFRLTRDLVDGMGLSGVEGVFRRCCEETLRVLRQNGDVIKTILEVFKYDPLFAWTSNPVKVLRAQRAGGEDGIDEGGDLSAVPPALRQSRHSTPASPALAGRLGTPERPQQRDTASSRAERAIGSVMTKLSSNLSVQYTVNELIQTATDEGNLSAIFHGWQAAL
ncbi:unnamed protein product [Jaminaea pallidilutea]